MKRPAQGSSSGESPLQHSTSHRSPLSCAPCSLLLHRSLPTGVLLPRQAPHFGEGILVKLGFATNLEMHLPSPFQAWELKNLSRTRGQTLSSGTISQTARPPPLSRRGKARARDVPLLLGRERGTPLWEQREELSSRDVPPKEVIRSAPDFAFAPDP